ncbi:MAG: hypothetical protein I3J03_12500 [Actinomyces succiniciruminis]|nr:hypothetical protein [Actinomyces succiniciruminis]
MDIQPELIDPAAIKDWEPGQGVRDYLLLIAAGPSEDRIRAVLEPHFRPNGDSFRSAAWDVEESMDADAELGFPWTVSVKGWPGETATRYVLQRDLGVAVETDASMPATREELVALADSRRNAMKAV